jgi:putative RNA 2'-phosphotransferase
MGQKKSAKKLSKFISYILGRNPHEFGLVLDDKGFIKIKELLKVMSEEDGWRHVRAKHIDEILMMLPDPPIEIKDKLIRAKYRDSLPKYKTAQNLPKLLYTCVRRKAYRFIIDKGIFPSVHKQIILSSDRELAELIGKRIDPEPVILTVQVNKSVEEGLVFYQAGESLFLADHIKPDCFTGPPLPKEKAKPTKTEKPEERLPPIIAGSFIADFKSDKYHQKKSDAKKKKKVVPWKKDRKKIKS